MDIIWPGCNQIVANATRQFLSRSGAYSTRSSRFSIYSLFLELIDPAWKSYLVCLPKSRLDELNLEENIGELAHKKSFLFLENKFREWLRASHKLQKISSDFSATLDTLIDLSMYCRVKKPRRGRKTSGDRVNSRRANFPNCQFCGKLTELFSFLQSGAWPDADPDQRARLSARYCSEHRPKNLDGTWNSAYLRAKRNAEKFAEEARALKKSSGPMRHEEQKNNSDRFAQKITEQLAAYPDEDEKFLNAARQLVDKKINDRKKHIIMLLATGKKQVDIAAELGITKQAVSKLLKSIPRMYRFDLPPDHLAE